MKKLSLDRQLLAGFGLAIIVLPMAGLLSWLAADRYLRSARDAVLHAEVLAPLETGLTRIYEVEAAQRGLMFTGSPAFAAQRAAALAGARAAYDELRERARRDAALDARVGRIQRLADQRIAELDGVLALHARDPAAARAALAGSGPDSVQALARETAALASEQQARLSLNAEASRRDAASIYAVLALAVLLVVTALVGILHGVLRGVAERQRAYAALASSQARLNAVVDTALDAIIVIDWRGVVEQFNAAAERMFGYAAAEVAGRNVSILMPSPDREAHDGYLARYRQTGERRIIGIGREVVGRRKDGSTFPVELAVGETQVGGQTLFTGLIRDITERKAAEERQRALLNDLKAANEELSNFAHVASHDLKAPLRAIGSLAQWLMADYGDRLDAEGREHMALLLSRVKRMDRLIDGILQYSRVGRVREAPARIDLAVLVAETVDLLAPPPHVAVTIGALPTVAMERTRAQQLFQNLLANAIQYMDKAQGEIHVDCVAEGGDWHFSVRDNGPGIERRHWGRVFQMFQSLGSRDHTDSTGIGLSLVKKIVEMHGGRIWLDSEIGRGATFHFTLPRTA